MNVSDVELSITVWERTWREALEPAFLERITQNLHGTLSRRSIVINNVTHPDVVADAAGQLVRDGLVDSYTFVSDRIDDALTATRLKKRHLAPIEHYSDHFLAKINDSPCKWLVHWDTDVHLVSGGDWVTPTISLMEKREDIAVGGPAWSDPVSMASEALENVGDHVLGYGFTDQIFLIEPARFRAPIYRKICPASWWYPTSHIKPIFEQRVDAWMRRSNLRRATYLPVVYAHDEVMADHPSRRLSDKVRRRLQNHLYDNIQRSRLSAPCFRR